MEHYNLKEMRRQLPLGAISEIADRLDISPTVVSNIFNKGRRGKYLNSVIACALEIIESQETNPEVMEKAKELNLTTTSLYPIVSRKKKKKVRKHDDDDDDDYGYIDSIEVPDGVKVLLKIAGIGLVCFIGYAAWKSIKNSGNNV